MIMTCIERSLYSLKKKILEEIIINYTNEYSIKKIRLAGKNKPDLVDIIIRENIEVDCKKYMPNVILNNTEQFYIFSRSDIEREFAALAARTTI
jgi:hypothetical protein